MQSFRQKFFALTPFWLFLVFFKFAAGLHYTLLSPLGAQVFPVWIVGILIGAAAFIQMLLDVPSGYLTDRFGYKRMLIVTTLAFMVAGACFWFGMTQGTFVISLIISIVGWQFLGPGSNAYTIGHADEKTVGKMLSASEVAASLGIVLTSILVAFAVSWSAPLLATVLIALFAVALLAILLAPRDHAPSHQSPHKKFRLRFWQAAWHSAKELRPVSYLLMVSNFTASTFYAIIWFVVPLLIASNIHAKTLGLGLGIFDFSVVVLGFFLGTIADKYNKKLLILLGITVFAVAGILLSTNFGFLFLLLGFVATAGDELTGLSLWAWLYATNKDHNHYGTLTGMIEVSSDLGWTVGPIAAGILYATIGASWTIAVGGILILINLFTYVLLVQHPLPAPNANITYRLRHKKHKH